MIAEVVPITDCAQPDCLEQAVRAAEQAAIDAHRIVVETYRRRALHLAEAATAALVRTRQSAPATIGLGERHTSAAVHTRNEAWFAASYAHQAGLCERQARTLERRLAHLEARWGGVAGE